MEPLRSAPRKRMGTAPGILATTNLPNGTHDLTATAADAAGNISSASSSLSVRVNAASLPPTPIRENLLLNGSFKATSARASEWPLVFTGSTATIEALWSDSLDFTAPALRRHSQDPSKWPAEPVQERLKLKFFPCWRRARPPCIPSAYTACQKQHSLLQSSKPASFEICQVSR